MFEYIEMNCGYCGKPFSAMIVDPEACIRDYCSDECDYAAMLKARDELWQFYAELKRIGEQLR